MNTAFYASLAYLPIGVAVTIEFLGPLTLAAVLSRRPRDRRAVAAAAVGVAPVRAFDASWGFDPIGIAVAFGAMWAAYIVLSQRTGKAFEGLRRPRPRPHRLDARSGSLRPGRCGD